MVMVALRLLICNTKWIFETTAGGAPLSVAHPRKGLRPPWPPGTHCPPHANSGNVGNLLYHNEQITAEISSLWGLLRDTCLVLDVAQYLVPRLGAAVQQLLSALWAKHAQPVRPRRRL